MNPFKRQIYKFGLLEANEKNPPTISDNSEEYTSGVFTFNNSHFTKDFEDLDGDGFKLTKIDSLPIVGNLNYNGNPVEEGFTFNLNNVSNLTYELPDNYMITSQGYCEFDKSIEEIISDQESEGFELIYLGGGRIEFKKESSSAIPNNTDIYAFFDATSMRIEDAEAANLALTEWFNEFKEDNALYEGNLYILPIVQENWVDFPNIIVRGSSNRVKNNPDRPNDDFMEFAILPDNFDRTSNDDNPNWIPPTEVVTLAFIDEVADGSQAYHKNRNGYGLVDQPTSQYLTDFKNFKENYENNFDFFKGVFYPIADIDSGNYNNIYNAAVLQGFSAIEGKATYTLEEIQDLGVSYAQERRFHWHLDPNNNYYTGLDVNVANPYSVEAETSVPNTSYNLQPLKNFGWAGSYDKDQPASEVFSSDTFNADLNNYLQGEVSTSEEFRVIEGNCVQSENICFDFKTSDDSDYLLFSNQASFCFTGSHEPENVDSVNAPTVESVNREVEDSSYDFIVNDFTNNFYDEDGDSFKDIKLINSFMSSKNITIEEILYDNNSITFPFTFNISNINLLEFNLPDDYYINKDRLVKYTSSLETDIVNIENQGYVLLENKGNKLIYNKLNTSDPQNPIVETESIEGKDIGNDTICLPFKTGDDSTYELFSNIANICLTLNSDNSITTVEGGSEDLINEIFEFSISDFTNNFDNSKGHIPKTVKIIDNLTDSGFLTFKGYEINLPFSFNIDDSQELNFQLKDNFIVDNGVIYEFEDSIVDIVDSYRNDGYLLDSNNDGILVFIDPDGNNPEIKYEGIILETTEFCTIFATSNNGFIESFSNEAEFCLIPQGDINIPELDNQPPTIGDITITVETEVTTPITMDMIKNQSQPPYSDKENDLIDAIRIDAINPNNTGRFYFDGIPVIIGQIITREQIESELFTHIGEDINDVKVDSFSFSIRDEVNRKWVQ